jgi:acyl-CoA thioester hydrolase
VSRERAAARSGTTWFETPVRVRYAETDKMGVVYHGNFFVWFEVARTDLCRQCGFSYRDMEIDEDAHLMVVEVRCRYRRPARYDDDLVVRTRVAAFARRSVRFAYEVVRAAGRELLAEGETAHVVTTADGRIRSFPAAQAALVLARLNGTSTAGTLDSAEDELSNKES